MPAFNPKAGSRPQVAESDDFNAVTSFVPEPEEIKVRSTRIIDTTYVPPPTDIDLFGNTMLHQCFGNNKVDINYVLFLLKTYPDLVETKNQFGRLPLHYAVDKIQADYAAIKLLLQYYPEGVNERDEANLSPYDIAVKWNHSKPIKRAILQCNPQLDWYTYVKLKYGMMSKAVIYMYDKPEMHLKYADSSTTFMQSYRDLAGSGECSESSSQQRSWGFHSFKKSQKVAVDTEFDERDGDIVIESLDDC